MYEEDFPGISIRVLEPELVLAGKAARGIFFVYRGNFGFLEFLLPYVDLFDRHDLDSQMIHAAGNSSICCFVHGKIEEGFFQVKLGVGAGLFLGFDSEDATIEVD